VSRTKPASSFAVRRGHRAVALILLRGGRAGACGVELMDEGLETIMAGEVVLSAGTVHSATILMHSGIRPAKQLRQHGIAVIVDASLKSGSVAEMLPWRVYVRRGVAPPCLDYCR
jgi:choline dehydrogenase